ncbi:MAG: class I SAM-dependent methyltransferase [Candidatus Competibacter sp.]|nr:class I SAM-dependent methyltransferase [Candidatus Contendobacter sp.]MDS4068354.1 class I SAM-dependent methyltransferase [Candidatus Competibacter sp.]
MNPACDVALNYDQYFASQLYDKRYPGPNQTSLAIVVREIHGGRVKVLDFGCGNGRYAAPLLERTDATIVACDISREAIDELSLRCAWYVGTGRLHPVCGDLSVLTRTLDRDGGFDLAIMMFGVLGHIFSGATRRKTLATIRGLLRPGGRIVVSVPNAARRFLKRQAMARRLIREGHLEPGDILYERTADSVVVEMYYHLYALREFVLELEQQGFRLIQVGAESVLPESAVVRSTALRWIDRMLATVVPLRCAYGFLAVAEVAPEAGTARAGHASHRDLPK